MRISDWSSDVCSSDLRSQRLRHYHVIEGRRFEIGESSVDIPLDDIDPGGDAIRDILWVDLHAVAADAMLLAQMREQHAFAATARPEERRFGKECDSTCRSGWSPDE